MRSVEEVGRGGRVDLGIKLCVFFVVLLCVCVVLGRGGRSGRSVEEAGSTLVSSFSKTQSRSVSGERQPDSARLGSARLGSSRLKNFSDEKKGRWYCGNALARRCRFMRSVDEVGR